MEAPSSCAHPVRCQLLLCHCLTDSKGGWLSAQNLFLVFFQGHLATAASQRTMPCCEWGSCGCQLWLLAGHSSAVLLCPTMASTCPPFQNKNVFHLCIQLWYCGTSPCEEDFLSFPPSPKVKVVAVLPSASSAEHQ